MLSVWVAKKKCLLKACLYCGLFPKQGGKSLLQIMAEYVINVTSVFALQ